MTGRTIGQYRVGERIGRGGMGVVYRAEDTNLHRTVALKFLPEESLDRAVRARFIQEARTAARLAHPNICPVYELVEAGDDVFFAMALLEGQTLAERIDGKPLEARTAAGLALQIAAGLEEAHRNGVIHRDIKASNVIVTADDHVYLLDFGLSLLTGTTRMTVPGSVAGTPSYMSPEQANGAEVDHRTDIWATGVVLYEMLAGRRPFDRDRDLSTLYAIVHETVPLLEGAPAGLAAIVAKCLAKAPAERYGSARELAADLRRFRDQQPVEAATMTQIRPLARPGMDRRLVMGMGMAGVAAVGLGVWKWRSAGPDEEKHIAILPFTVIGGDENTRAISDGIVETLTSQLSQAENAQRKLFVVPASEIRSRKIASAEEARRIYGANLVVTGSAEILAELAHFTVNLIDATSMRQVGSSSFSFDGANPIGIRKEALTRLLTLLNVQLAGAAEGETANPAAYTQYLRGRGFMARYDVPGNLDRAIESFQAATAADARYALAYTGLGEALWQRALDTGDKAVAARAVEAAERAVQLNGKLAGAHARLGDIYAQNGRREEAVAELRAALALEPANADAHRGLGGLYSNLGRFREAEEAYQQATRLRPTDWFGFVNLAVFYWDQNRYAEAEGALRTAVALTPDNDIVHRNLAGLFVVQGKYQQARDEARTALRLKPSARTYSLLGATHYFQKQYKEAAAALEASVDLDANYYAAWGNLGGVYRWLPGSEGKAKAALGRAVELARKRLEVTPQNHAIRASLAEYQAKLGFPREALAEIERIPVTNRGAYWGRIALAYELAGERGRAVRTVQEAVKSAALPHEVKDDPDLEKLLGDPGLRGGLGGR